MIKVSEHLINSAEELKRFSKESLDTGAIVSFIGTVREEGNDPVLKLQLDYFPGVTERSVAKIEDNAKARWNTKGIAILHRIGDIKPGEVIVLVCVSSRHRRDAFEAADYIMDHLKTTAMFWKKEIRKSGATWIEPRADDYNDVRRWSDNICKVDGDVS